MATVANAAPRHRAFVRVTHWLTTLCFFALLVSGIEIVVSHPRFYWGETGNVLTSALFSLPIPSSRATVPTGYGFVKFINRLVVTDNLKRFGQGLGSAAPEAGYAWFAGI